MIAAAPELVEALREAIEEIEDLRGYANSHGGMIDNERCDDFRTLLARIEGEQP